MVVLISWLLVPKIATILESIPGYVSNPGDGDATQAQFAMGVSRVGQAVVVTQFIRTLT